MVGLRRKRGIQGSATSGGPHDEATFPKEERSILTGTDKDKNITSKFFSSDVFHRVPLLSIFMMKFSIRPSWLALLIILESCLAVYGYLNPILPGVNPDPSILRVGPDYWLVVSSFEFMPGIPIYHSTDLVNWTLHSHALTRPSQLSLYMVPQSLGKSSRPKTRSDAEEALEAHVHVFTLIMSYRGVGVNDTVPQWKVLYLVGCVSYFIF